MAGSCERVGDVVVVSWRDQRRHKATGGDSTAPIIAPIGVWRTQLPSLLVTYMTSNSLLSSPLHIQLIAQRHELLPVLAAVRARNRPVEQTGEHDAVSKITVQPT